MIKKHDPGERERCCSEGMMALPGGCGGPSQTAGKLTLALCGRCREAALPISIAYNSTKISNSSLEIN
jgi:hypothetical protein